MDLKQVIIRAAEAIIETMPEARMHLGEKVKIGNPSRLEIEFGINGSYELANFDDSSAAKVRFQIPLYGTDDETPASAALAAEKPAKSKKKA